MGRILMFACEPGPVVGGYGDRIVGLVAVRALAKRLGRPFQVLWTRDNLDPYFDYSAVDHKKLKPYDGWFRCVRMIDQPTRLANHLATSPLPLAEPGDADRQDILGTSISVNSETAQYLFRNRHFAAAASAAREYLATMQWAYRTLYTEVLRPTPKVKERMQKVVGDRADLVGIQVRAGDAYMDTKQVWDQRTQYLAGEAGVRQILESLRERIAPEATVFVTGDHPKTVELAREVFGADRVLGDAEPAQHLDRRQEEHLDHTKLYSDALILAQRCTTLYISANSNFGRVAALAGGVRAVFGLDGAPLREWDLLSKSGCIWATGSR